MLALKYSNDELRTKKREATTNSIKILKIPSHIGNGNYESVSAKWYKRYIINREKYGS